MPPLKILIGIAIMIVGLVVGFAVPIGDGIIRFTLFESALLCGVFGGLAEAVGGDASVCVPINAMFGASIAVFIAGIAVTVWGLKSKR